MKIVEKSPVILFRRMPEPEPRLVYVSENINRIGYSADDFIEERIKFPILCTAATRNACGRKSKTMPDGI
jgi:hypothetical protein